MLRAWNRKKWWNLCMSGDEKKEPIFTELCFQFIRNIQYRTFWHRKLCMKT